VEYSPITRCLRVAEFPLWTEEVSDADDRKPTDDADEAILSTLNESPFAPLRQLSRLTHLPPMTVYRRLTQAFVFTAHYLRWVPHALSDVPKAQRMTLSRWLLRMLEVQDDRARRDIVTLDEPWFYLRTYHEFIWLPQKGKVSEWECHMIPSKKFILTIHWNLHSFP
jgi:hypothetical protein